MNTRELGARRNPRQLRYAYSNGGTFFITIATKNRTPLFGTVEGDVMVRSPLGDIVAEEWQRSSSIRHELGLDAWVLMPDHLHGIVVISCPTSNIELSATDDPDVSLPERRNGPARSSIGAFIAGFKSATTRRINAYRNTPGAPVWQRSYHERRIRSEHAMNQIRRYIERHPQR